MHNYVTLEYGPACILEGGLHFPLSGEYFERQCKVIENELYLEVENYPSRNPGLNHSRPEDGLLFKMVFKRNIYYIQRKFYPTERGVY